MAIGSLLDAVEDAARDDFNASHLPWRIDVEGPRSAVTSRVRMGGSWFVDCRVRRMTGRRGVRDIRETPGDFIAVLLVDRGTEIFTQNDVETAVPAGTAALWDSVWVDENSRCRQGPGPRRPCPASRIGAPQDPRDQLPSALFGTGCSCARRRMASCRRERTPSFA